MADLSEPAPIHRGAIKPNKCSGSDDASAKGGQALTGLLPARIKTQPKMLKRLLNFKTSYEKIINCTYAVCRHDLHSTNILRYFNT
jgi:hypothetical protein